MSETHDINLPILVSFLDLGAVDCTFSKAPLIEPDLVIENINDSLDEFIHVLKDHVPSQIHDVIIFKLLDDMDIEELTRLMIKSYSDHFSEGD